MLTNIQKEKALEFLQERQTRHNFKEGLCFWYEEYLDEKEEFTDFNCGPRDKYILLDVIHTILLHDKSAKIWIEIYDMDYHGPIGSDPFIYSDTVWIETTLTKDSMKAIFEDMDRKHQVS